MTKKSNCTKELLVHEEKISHFNCVDCKKWWSISGALKSKKFWYCPWCGKKHITN